MIYADHAATTRISESALRVYDDVCRSDFGNPSSLYADGRKARAVLEQARREVADCLGADPVGVIFTSGGSESDNCAIRAAAALGRAQGKCHLISTQFEHHAVLHTLRKLEREGYSVTLLAPDREGFIHPEQVEEAITPDTALVSVMTANNEIGTIQPAAEIGEVCRRHGVLFHTDAVQAAGHIPVHFRDMHADFLALSAHKFEGPRGTGALLVRPGLAVEPLIEGGGQERGRRAGTENTAGIAAMAAALRENCAQMAERSARVADLRDRLIDAVLQIPGSHLNGSRKKRLPGNASFVFEGIESESLLLLLDSAGIEASTGSSCSAGSVEPSHVLLSIGVPEQLAHGSLRLTLGPENTEQEIDEIAETLRSLVEELRENAGENP